MIVDFKNFDVDVQKALNIKTCSCDWIGKSIIGVKKKRSKKQKPNKQKQTKNKEKNPHKFDDALKHLISYGTTFLFLLFILTKQLYFIQMGI